MNEKYVILQTSFQKLIRRMGEEWGKFMPKGISASHVSILWMLNDNDSLKVSELAHRLGITPGGMTGLSDKLASCGYIERVRCEEDRRVVHLKITGEGRQFLQELKEHNAHLMARLFAGFEEEDGDRLLELIRKIMDNMEMK